MDYAALFDEFWKKKSRYLGLSNPERTHRNIREALAKCKHVVDIEDYVRELTNGKETNRKIIVEYFNYIEEKTGEKIYSELYEKELFNSTIERRLALAKYLHEPHTLEEIEEHFNISGETRKKDMRALAEGIEFLGATISIVQTRKNGKDYYRTTLHPIFLPLNLTQVYAMTTYLEHKLDPADPNTRIIRGISERIKSQLSNYAFHKLFPYERRKPIDNGYVDDESFVMNGDGMCMYLMKSGRLCKFLWKGQEYEGRIKSMSGKYYIELEDGEPLDAEPSDVYFLTESFEYK